MTTSTLETGLGSIGSTAYSYLSIVITTYWPFLLGVIILVGALAFGKSAIARMFGR
jgi:ABC-type uncharacterized transport system permease subunit